jgi:hydrogenase maturation protease
VKQTLVLAIGNTLLTDEGAGIYTLHECQRVRGSMAGVNWIDGGTLSFTLAPLVEDCDRLIVIDAVRLGSGVAAGSVAIFEDGAMDALINSGKRTPHEVSISDLLAMAQLQDRLPQPRALVAIQPAEIDWGEAPTAAVAAAIPQAAAEVLALIDRWQAEDGG